MGFWSSSPYFIFNFYYHPRAKEPKSQRAKEPKSQRAKEPKKVVKLKIKLKAVFGYLVSKNILTSMLLARENIKIIKVHQRLLLLILIPHKHCLHKGPVPLVFF